jgi:hypothetical protein
MRTLSIENPRNPSARRGWRGRFRLCGLILFLILSGVAAADAQEPECHPCGWGPVSDLAAVRTLLHEWSVSTGLPPFDPKRWDVSIDHSSVWARLYFAEGDVRVGWELDADCEPTAITIETSSGYRGVRPDEDAVRRLVAKFRTVTAEQRFQPHYSNYPGRPFVGLLPSSAIVAALAVMLAGVLLPLRRRWRAAGVAPADVAQLLGLLVVVALLPYESGASVSGLDDWLQANLVILLGVLPLVGFLWLVLSGFFGYGSVRRGDWVALPVFLLSLAVREGFARHAIQEIEIYFAYGPFPNRHSFVHPLFQWFVQSLAADPYRFVMHVNGVLGAVATLPLFLFVRRRTGSRMAAALVATFYALHPIIVQMTPTDGPYALIMATWFGGLALLTADAIGARQLFGGAVLLGIAATSRAEGSLYLAASLLLVDVRALLAAMARYFGVAVMSAAVVLGMIAVHVYLCFGTHVPAGESLPAIGSVTLPNVVRAALYSEEFNDPVFVWLVLVGAMAGLVSRRMRIGLGAALATMVVGWPLSMATWGGFTVLHRLVTMCAMQVIAAGVGAAWLTGWLPSRVRRHWAAALPAMALAFFIFAKHSDAVREPNAVTDEFWLLRNRLAPGGAVITGCTLLSYGRSMDTDIHDFGQVLPGMRVIRCEQEDCVSAARRGGCLYYLRSLNCFHFEWQTPAECLERGRTPAGDLFACMEPQCARLESTLDLTLVEERTVDLQAVFHGLPERPQWPRTVDIALFKVVGVRQAGR